MFLHTAKMPDGTTVKRQSANRQYRYVIAALYQRELGQVWLAETWTRDEETLPGALSEAQRRWGRHCLMLRHFETTIVVKTPKAPMDPKERELRTLKAAWTRAENLAESYSDSATAAGEDGRWSAHSSYVDRARWATERAQDAKDRYERALAAQYQQSLQQSLSEQAP
jgi:hypothetical protein